MQYSINVAIKSSLWSGWEVLGLALNTPSSLLGWSSRRGLGSWGKLPVGPRPHLHPIRPGVPPSPVLGFRPVCICLLSPLLVAPWHQPLLKQHCWRQLSKQADHPVPFFLPFLLVLLILNTARRLLGLLSWNEHSPKGLY